MWIVGMRLIDVAHDWRKSVYNTTEDQVEEFLKIFKERHRESPLTVAENVNWSVEQLVVLKILNEQIRDIKENHVGNGIKRVVVQGKAGTGKSTLIHEIVRRVQTEFHQKNVVTVGAPTGVAAVNIEGHTLHSLMRIPIKASKFEPLNGPNKKKFKQEMENVKFLIMDEMSMIGTKLLYKIEQR